MKKKTDSKNLKVLKSKTRRIMISSNCTVCVSKKVSFNQEQKTSGSRLKTGLDKIPIIGIILF